MSTVAMVALAAAGANAAIAAWLYRQLSQLRRRVDNAEATVALAWERHGTSDGAPELPASYRVAADVEPLALQAAHDDEGFALLIRHGDNEWLVYDYDVKNVDRRDPCKKLFEFRLLLGGLRYHLRGEVSFYAIFECASLLPSALGKFVDRDGDFAEEYAAKTMLELVERWRRREQARVFWDPRKQHNHDEDEDDDED